MKAFIPFLGLLAASTAAPAPAGSDGGSSSSTTSSASAASSSSSVEDGSLLQQMQQIYMNNTLPLLGVSGTNCTSSNALVRRSWSALSTTERTAYLSAVKCLHSKPSTISASIAPGARNRMDDFTYSHINQTNYIHASGLLLPWHRQFTWAYEQALRNECGYEGAQPYWDFSEYADDQSKSPVWDGSATSFGSNGQYVPHNGTTASIPGLPTPITITRPAGSGGSCVTVGGLVDASSDNSTWQITLGPVAPANNTPDNTYGLQANPRCLKRDWYGPLSSNNLSWAMTNTLLRSADIHTFRPFMDAEIHPSAHQFPGGDLYDLFTSPNDPVFYLLHAQVDRLWTVWQGQDYTNRGLGLDGTQTFMNDPPSANTTLDTVMKMFLAGGDVPVSSAMSAVGYGSEYCYLYE